MNLVKKENPNKIKNFTLGQFVTLNDENLVTIAGSRQFITPHSKDVYKIIAVLKGGFSLRLLNLRTLGELTCVHTRVSYFSLDDIDGYELY